MWRRFLKRDAGIRIHEMLRIMLKFPGFQVHHRHGALSAPQRNGHRILHTLVVPRHWLQPIYHQFNEMRLVSVQCRDGREVMQFTVNAHLCETTFTQLVEEFPVMSLPAPDQRRQKVAFPAIVIVHYQTDNLLVRIAHHFFPRHRRVRPGRPGIKQTQEVENLGDSPHRGTRIVSGGLLLNRDNRAKAVDFIDFRLFQNAHEMLGVCGQSIHITPLAFGINRVESQ